MGWPPIVIKGLIGGRSGTSRCSGGSSYGLTVRLPPAFAWTSTARSGSTSVSRGTVSGASPLRHPDGLPGGGVAEHGPVRGHAPRAPASGGTVCLGGHPPLSAVPPDG